jgi:voltage-gated potassium channel Kch
LEATSASDKTPPGDPPVGRRLQRFAQRATLPRAIGLISVATLGFTLVAALVERIVEPHTFTSYGLACWWAVQTVSTVGYGDITPVTAAGRSVAAAVQIFSVALVPAVTSIVVAILIEQRRVRG